VSVESRGITSLIGIEALPLLPMDVDEGTTSEGKLGEGVDTTGRLTPSTNNGIDLEIAVLLSLFRLSSTFHSDEITSLIGDPSASPDNLLLLHWYCTSRYFLVPGHGSSKSSLDATIAQFVLPLHL